MTTLQNCDTVIKIHNIKETVKSDEIVERSQLCPIACIELRPDENPDS